MLARYVSVFLWLGSKERKKERKKEKKRKKKRKKRKKEDELFLRDKSKGVSCIFTHFLFSSLFSDAPLVSLRLGRTLDPTNLHTGHDVYFECDVKANPPSLRLEWSHNGRILSADPARGVVMSSSSLVLQRVTKEAVGDYACRAVNAEGMGESNSVPLKIMCE